MNLLICSSPFQVLVAKRIINKYPSQSFYGMMLIVADNDKYHYYAKELTGACQGNGDSYILKKNKQPVLILWDLLQLKLKGLSLKNIDNIYVASFDSIVVQTLISGINFKELYTFDDGTANLIKDSYYYTKDRHTGFINRVLKRLFFNPYDLHILKQQSMKHYTVFNRANVMKSSEYLPLYAQQTSQPTSNYQHSISIMIGQPIYEMDKTLNKAKIKQKNQQLTKQIIQQFHIKQYLPHPRENYHLDDVDYIQTPLVAEDYFAQNLKENTHYTLYTFCSGAVLPFVGMDNVSIVAILPKDCPKALLPAYELFQEFGMTVMSVDSPVGDTRQTGIHKTDINGI